VCASFGPEATQDDRNVQSIDQMFVDEIALKIAGLLDHRLNWRSMRAGE